MTTTRIQGHRHPPDPPRRRGQGHRPRRLRRRRPAGRPAARPHPAQPARPRPHQVASTPARPLALPGVEAVVTSADLPDPGNRIAELGEGRRQPAAPEQQLPGPRQGAVPGPRRRRRRRRPARTSPRKRWQLIKVEYEPLPPVHRRPRGDEGRRAAPARRPGHRVAGQADRQGRPTSPSTSSSSWATSPRASRQAAVVIEREFHTATVHQGYIEPHNATALWNADGTVTIWCSTQGAFTVRAQVAELLQHAAVARSRSCRWRSAAASAARFASTSNRSPRC